EEDRPCWQDRECVDVERTRRGGENFDSNVDHGSEVRRVRRASGVPGGNYGWHMVGAVSVVIAKQPAVQFGAPEPAVPTDRGQLISHRRFPLSPVGSRTRAATVSSRLQAPHWFTHRHKRTQDSG